MRIDVYETEGEALAAAADLVERLLADGGAAPAVALPGGRGGRPIMLALASRKRIPWKRARFAVVSERGTPSEEAPTNRRLLRDHFLAPHGVPAIEVDERDPARGWGQEVRRGAGEIAHQRGEEGLTGGWLGHVIRRPSAADVAFRRRL